MTEQELSERVLDFCWKNQCNDYYEAIVSFAKAYAAARVAETKTEGTEFIEQRNAFAKQIRELRDQVAAKDAEITQLKASLERYKAQLSNAGATHFAELGSANQEIRDLEAENKRMQNALLDIESDANAKNACGLPLSVKETLHSARQGLGMISPAPVTEGREEGYDPEPPQPKDENGLLPTDDEIAFIASDESNHHDWMDLGFRNTYQQGFEDGAKWMRNKKRA